MKTITICTNREDVALEVIPNLTRLSAMSIKERSQDLILSLPLLLSRAVDLVSEKLRNVFERLRNFRSAICLQRVRGESRWVEMERIENTSYCKEAFACSIACNAHRLVRTLWTIFPLSRWAETSQQERLYLWDGCQSSDDGLGVCRERWIHFADAKH